MVSAPLLLPRGVSLDGNGKTIVLAGHAERFESVAVHVSGASVSNLTIDGRNLSPDCPTYIAALVVSGPGAVENIVVTNLRFEDSCAAAVGVEVSVFDGDAIDLKNITLANVDGVGILMTGDGRVTVDGSHVENAAVGIQVMNTIEASITNAATEVVNAGVVVTGHARARVHGSETPDRVGGMSALDNGQATLGNLTLAGFGAPSLPGLDAPRLTPGPAGTLSTAPRQSGRF